ncbi:hypothetical protein SAMN02745704_00069 [Paucidesulfovibrio gracilis DSM 16080]|uniref:Uncharacterized protein n=1 Tax=Paucidesulfovibrio gracilis DSM 16080 TaxID=1121449 RepID=A0A1T4W1Y5_9BACT|nr:hypothetical protein [Paucidesulfovibrio gracilis]SKA71075.1 hypothetical protein SAMN02745704_00069 [Paucidesulfovibrio gracilis DSM 16080]
MRQPTFRSSSPRISSRVFAALFLVGMFFLAWPLPGSAQDDPSVEQLAEFLNTTIYQELILSQWQRQSMVLCGEPSQPGPLRHAGLSVYERVDFDNGRPHNGIWADRYRGRACGRERQFNFLFTAQNGQMVVRHMLPGRTEAPPRLQLDTMKAALPRLMDRHPECQSFIPVNSELERAPRHVNDAWSELWTFDACGQLSVVRVEFTPDRQGGTYYKVH